MNFKKSPGAQSTKQDSERKGKLMVCGCITTAKYILARVERVAGSYSNNNKINSDWWSWLARKSLRIGPEPVTKIGSSVSLFCGETKVNLRCFTLNRRPEGSGMRSVCTGLPTVMVDAVLIGRRFEWRKRLTLRNAEDSQTVCSSA